MTDARKWRDMSPEETAVIAVIITQSGVVEAQPLLAELDGALVAHESQWIIDVAPGNTVAPTPIADGPFSAHADVTSGSAHQGEIIVWMKDGHLNGLEFAWVSDNPPSRWPRPDEMEVVTDRRYPFAAASPAEYDVVRLRIALPQFGLAAGSEGTVVMDHSRYAERDRPRAYEVEFAGVDGAFTVAEAHLEVVSSHRGDTR